MTYFVAYSVNGALGNIEVSVSRPITGMDVLEKMSGFIKEKLVENAPEGFEAEKLNPVIINFRRFEQEERSGSRVAERDHQTAEKDQRVPIKDCGGGGEPTAEDNEDGR